MRPLITPKQYKLLRDLRARMDRSYPGNSHVFVPVGPDAEIGSPSILFIGQATRDWTKPALGNYAGAVNEAVAIAHCCLDRHGPFWQVVDEVVWGVCEALNKSIANQGDVVGWSNLAKIGRAQGNPEPNMIAAQQALCIELLRHELEIMQPDAVVLLTRNFGQREILEPVFGREGWTQDVPSDDRVAHKVEKGRPIVWMNHPRNPGPAGYRKASVKLAIQLIVDHL